MGRLTCMCERDPGGRCPVHGPEIKRDIARCFDKATGDEVFVAGGEYSINGTEPMPVPGDLRHLGAFDAAKQLLEIHLGRRRRT